MTDVSGLVSSGGVGPALSAVSVLAGLAVVAALLAPTRVRSAVVGYLVAAAGGVGAVAGGIAVAGGRFTAWLPWLLPLSGARIELDALGGLFMAVAGFVVAVAGVYSVGYSGQGYGPVGRGSHAALPVFAWSMLLVPAAGSAVTFLALWELMAVASLVLIVAEYQRRPQVMAAGLWYAVMTQLGFLTLLAAFAWYAVAAGGDGFDQLRSAHPTPATRSAIFVLSFLGFGSKAGLMPLHVWLPKAHPEAPSYVSAMLSAAMVNLGVYGVVRVGLDLLGGGPQWWWLLLLAVGAVSALYAILQAVVANDLKRLLAYSTVENMGLIFVGVGLCGVLRASGASTLANLALAAALLHIVNHAAFKTLLFGAAGSVVRTTHTRDLDALGGLRAAMPATTVLFAIGALGASALPPGTAFTSEWLLLQSLIHAAPAGGVVTAVAVPLALAAIALTAGLAAATFVKALGVGFFARARGEGAAHAREAPVTMLVAMSVAALACVALAVSPTALAPALSAAVGATDPATDAAAVHGGLTVGLAAVSSTVSPAAIALAVVVGIVAVALVVRVATARVRRRREVALWDCGAGAPNSRMQYTATSFAEPLQRVFDTVLEPQVNVDVVPYAESAYLIEKMAYERRLPDRVEHRFYQPLIAGARKLAKLGPILANGSVHRYLAYGFSGIVGLLMVLAVLS